MGAIRIPTEAEVGELVSVTGDVARGLAFERDLLRELVKAKSQFIACQDSGKKPSPRLYAKLHRLQAMLFPKGVPTAECDE